MATIIPSHQRRVQYDDQTVMEAVRHQNDRTAIRRVVLHPEMVEIESLQLFFLIERNQLRLAFATICLIILRLGYNYFHIYISMCNAILLTNYTMTNQLKDKFCVSNSKGFKLNGAKF